MRPVVSYDDITLPYESPATKMLEPFHGTPRVKFNPNNRPSTTTKSASSKKRKRKSRYSSAATAGNHNYTGHESTNDEEADGDAEYLEVEESRELTHDEIWDDSALIEAWNAATEEYKAYHGPDKGWKNEPIHKSPLWYNIPPPPSKKQKTSHPLSSSVVVGTAVTVSVEDHNLSKGSTSAESEKTLEFDSKPIDFDTFVPTHDAGLSLAVPAPQTASHGGAGTDIPSFSSHRTAGLSSNPGQMVNQDEAFKRALEATYWSGYWTAVYHSYNQKKDIESSSAGGQRNGTTEEASKEEDGIVDDAEMTTNDVQAILDIGNNSEFEGDIDLVDDEGEEFGGKDVNEVSEEEENDSLASSSRDFVSTQR